MLFRHASSTFDSFSRKNQTVVIKKSNTVGFLPLPLQKKKNVIACCRYDLGHQL